MLASFFMWIKGYVIIEITGEYPERFMNLCGFGQRDIWGFCKTEQGLQAKCGLGQYHELRPVAHRAKCKMHIVAKKGLIFFLRRYRARWGVVVGMMLFVAMLALLSSRIWRIEIHGNQTIPDHQIVAMLQDEGVNIGVSKNAFSWATLRQSVLLKHPEIGWMSLNPEGAVLRIDISESKQPPSVPQREEPCHIKADYDGRIIEIQAHVGQPMVQVGDGVVKGDILISGAVEYANGCTVFRHAKGIVKAETTHKKEFVVPLSETVLQPSSKPKVRYVFHCFGIDVPLYLGSLEGEYEKTKQEHMLTIQGVPLPIGFTKGTFLPMEEVEVTYTKREAEAKALEQAKKYQTNALSKTEVVDCSYSSTVQEGKLILKAQFFCVEDITFEEKLLIFS